jgi:hypothetical protein
VPAIFHSRSIVLWKEKQFLVDFQANINFVI